jgi:DNA polymerase I-like protein with 3'-5' exonuclease and polymerase domains
VSGQLKEMNYGAIRTAAAFKKCVDKILDRGKAFGFDIESGYRGADRKDLAKWEHHPDWMLVGFSFAITTTWARYIPIAHDSGDNADDIPEVARQLWRLLQSGLGVAHNLPFELTGLSRWFCEVLWDDEELGAEIRRTHGFFPFKSDTMIEVFEVALYAPKPAGGPGLGLKELVKKIWGHQMTEFMDLFPLEDGPDGPPTPKNKRPTVRFNTRELSDRVIEYCCEDSTWCLALHELHYPMLLVPDGKGGLKENLIHKTEMALLPVTVQMEYDGMLLDWDKISSKADELAVFRDFMNEEILAELSSRLGEIININLNSSDQLGEVLFDKLGLPVKKRTDSGKPSTDEESLRAIAKVDPVIRAILDYKQVVKLYGSYLHKYRTELHYDTAFHRAHPNHNQVGALTGRFSVDHVSYQQWPKPYYYKLKNGLEFEFNFRDLFISPEYHRIIGYDFSQVELRVIAGLAHETAMLEAFANGTDIHKATAASMFGIPLEEVTKPLRAKGKTGNFAVVYQSGAQNMADMMGTTKEEAQELLDRYYDGFPNLRNWMDKQIATGHEQGYVETLFGRKFTLWDYSSPNKYIRSKGDRMCINAPVQGGAADYMKIGMVRANKAIRKAERDGVIPPGSVTLILTIHDALEFYVHKSVATQTVIDLITPAVSFKHPALPVIKTDWHEGPSWGTAIEIKLDANGQIKSFEHTVELNDGTEKHWEGDTLEEVLDAFTEWNDEYTARKQAEQAALNIGAPKPFVKPKPLTKAQREKAAKVTLDDLILAIPFKEDTQEELPPKAATAKPTVEVLPKTRKPTAGKRPSSAVSLLATDGDLTDIELEEIADPEWLHGAEWHKQHDEEQSMVMADPQKVTIVLSDMPDEVSWGKFVDYLDEHPGSNIVEVETPEGTSSLGDYNITAVDQPHISLILGGAKVIVAPLHVDIDSLAGALDL